METKMGEVTPFKFEEIEDFDKHINLSIPNYETLCNVFKGIVSEFAQPEGQVVDLGCSTGKFLASLNHIEDCQYIGIDKVNIVEHETINFIEGDIESELYKMKESDTKPSVLISMFTLQFLGVAKRKRVLHSLEHLVRFHGATLLIAEKVYLNDPKLQMLIHRMHISEKRKNFTDKDILDKDTKLSVSMFCKTETEIEKELMQIGNVSKVWQSYNFMGFVVGQ